jgi:hypothetical protein
VERNDATGLDQRAPGGPVGQQSFFAVIAVDEHEIDRRMIV